MLGNVARAQSAMPLSQTRLTGAGKPTGATVTQTLYDVRGMVIQTTSPDGRITDTVYDARGRVQYQDDPHFPGKATDGTETFYDNNNQLLVDQGNDSLAGASFFPLDEYIWLGGRPVVMFRGRLNNDYWYFPRVSDATGDCKRNGEAAACGRVSATMQAFLRAFASRDWDALAAEPAPDLVVNDLGRDRRVVEQLLGAVEPLVVDQVFAPEMPAEIGPVPTGLHHREHQVPTVGGAYRADRRVRRRLGRIAHHPPGKSLAAGQ